MYIKNIVLIFSLFKTVFLTIFVLVYTMVNSKYSMGIYKSVKISNGTDIKNPEMLKFVPDHHKNKKMCNHAVKKFLKNHIF